MSEMEVVEAFLSQEPADGTSMTTDGERLCINSEVIAEWFDAGMIVTPVKQGQLQERIKDRLVHTVLLRMAGQQTVEARRPVTAAVGVS